MSSCHVTRLARPVRASILEPFPVTTYQHCYTSSPDVLPVIKYHQMPSLVHAGLDGKRRGCDPTVEPTYNNTDGSENWSFRWPSHYAVVGVSDSNLTMQQLEFPMAPSLCSSWSFRWSSHYAAVGVSDGPLTMHWSFRWPSHYAVVGVSDSNLTMQQLEFPMAPSLCSSWSYLLTMQQLEFPMALSLCRHIEDSANEYNEKLKAGCCTDSGVLLGVEMNYSYNYWKSRTGGYREESARIRSMVQDNMLANVYVRQTPGYAGFVPRAPPEGQMERKSEGAHMVSTMKATYRELPAATYQKQLNARKGPFSKTVTLTYPFNPYNKVVQRCVLTESHLK
ncbi:uncharacterized protein [Argopecten irradians]|uniref:uncharacterized protein n=1 Tax=Argopecten irradians TaxID=31199 RepID=UPI00370FF351